MLQKEIEIGGYYTAKVSGKLTTVRIDDIREHRYPMSNSRNNKRYDVTNMVTGRKITFRSAAKFRRPTQYR